VLARWRHEPINDTHQILSMKANTALIATLALALAACGGGGGDDTPNQSAAGFWQGTGKDGRTVWGLGQANGDYWVLMSAPGDANTLAGAEQGHIDAVRGSTLESSQSTAYDWLTTQASGPGFDRLQATSKSTLTGSINSGAVTYSLSYQSAFEQSTTLADLAGTYSGRMLSTTDTSHPTLVADSSGTISGNYVDPISASCTYSGSLTTTAQPSVYAMTVTFGSNCRYPGTTATGSLFFDKVHATVYAVALKWLGTGVRAFAFVGRPTPP
jgi:hypothetical protein